MATGEQSFVDIQQIGGTEMQNKGTKVELYSIT